MDAEQILEKIVDKSGAEREEIEDEIEEKMEEFSGLVSEEGAVHLIAKEHGVDIGEKNDQELKVENIVPEMRKVDVKGRIVNVSDVNEFERDEGEDGKVQNVVLGDDTGTIRLTLWDEQTEIGEKVSDGDAIKIESAYTVEDNRGNAELRLGDSSQVKMAEEGEVPEADTGPGEATETSIRDVKSENTTYRVRGMLVDVYTSNPFYRVDPETGNTLQQTEEGAYVTEDGEEIDDPEKRLAVSGVLDDGTDNIRVVFFRDIARKVLGIDEEAEKEGDVKAVEKAAEKAIGKELEIEGRARYNDYFGRIELLANDAEELDTTQQIEELLELMEA